MDFCLRNHLHSFRSICSRFHAHICLSNFEQISESEAVLRESLLLTSIDKQINFLKMPGQIESLLQLAYSFPVEYIDTRPVEQQRLFTTRMVSMEFVQFNLFSI